MHQLTTSMPYTQCNKCHNRGNYSLADVQFHPRQDRRQTACTTITSPSQSSPAASGPLDCADCHTRQEAMGDGHIYNNKKEIQYHPMQNLPWHA